MTRAASAGKISAGRRFTALALFLLACTSLSVHSREAAYQPDVVQVGQSMITVEWRGEPADIGRPSLRAWVERSGTVVRNYYGVFPVGSVALRITTVAGSTMGGGRTVGLPQPFIEVSVGQHVTPKALEDDWVLVHEMIHLALPAVAPEQNWLAEGVATYVEGIARVQAGSLSAVDLWDEYVKAMPQGLPAANDAGLDRTHSWARTYWGGALYCLEADVRIHEQTENRLGLQDALRAVEEAGAGMANEWPVGRVFATGDAATGTTVMTDLYRAMKDSPRAPDLEAMWADLGIRRTKSGIAFDDDARHAAVRRAITGPHGSPGQSNPVGAHERRTLQQPVE